MKTQDFLLSLRKEIINTQNLRFKFAFQKLLFIISLLGIGSISKEVVNLHSFQYLVYFVPFVAFMFDIYIMGENFGIRRIGHYLKFVKSASPEERYWEFILNIPENKSRDVFAIQGNIFSTLISIVLSAFLLLVNVNSTTGNLNWEISYLDIIWIVLVIVSAYITWFYNHKRLNEKLLSFDVNLTKHFSTWKKTIKDERDKLTKAKTIRSKNLKTLKSRIAEIYNQIE